jgi:hypothetical protein
LFGRRFYLGSINVPENCAANTSAVAQSTNEYNHAIHRGGAACGDL